MSPTRPLTHRRPGWRNLGHGDRRRRDGVGARIPAVAAYDRVAPTYRAYRRLWIVLAGRAAERRLHRRLDEVLRSGQRVLDAGSGSGAVSEAVVARQPDVRLVMLDASVAMLHQAPPGLAASNVQGDVAALPFPDGSFDVVVSAWVLEIVAHPTAVVRELLRVLAPGGQLLMVFSALPAARTDQQVWRPVQHVIETAFAGRFLVDGDVPFHDCPASTQLRGRHLPAATMFLADCCSVPPASGIGLEVQQVPPWSPARESVEEPDVGDVSASDDVDVNHPSAADARNRPHQPQEASR